MAKIKPRSSLFGYMTTVFTGVVFTFLVYGNAHHAIAESLSDKPYNAKTVEECIHEKECVWSVFSGQLFNISDVSNDYPRSGLVRMRGKIAIMFAGNHAYGKYVNYFVSIAKELGPYADLPIDVLAQPYNHYIAITDDIDQEFSRIMPKLAELNALGYASGTFELYKEKGCISFYITGADGGYITQVFTIIDTRKKQVEACMAQNFYASYGPAIVKHEFSGITDLKNIHFTKIDKFVLFLLYQSEFKGGQSFEQVKAVFEELYEAKKEIFLMKLDQEGSVK